MGNRKFYTASLPSYAEATGALTYEYDAKGQLKQEQSARGGRLDHAFAYDGAGNPTTFQGAAQDFNQNNHRAGSDLSHDSNGKPTTYKCVPLAFDPENRLISYGSFMTAGYRGGGLRAWKENTEGRTYFLYDGVPPVVEVNPASGSVVNTFGAAGLVSRLGGGRMQGGQGTSY